MAFKETQSCAGFQQLTAHLSLMHIHADNALTNIKVIWRGYSGVAYKNCLRISVASVVRMLPHYQTHVHFVFCAHIVWFVLDVIAESARMWLDRWSWRIKCNLRRSFLIHVSLHFILQLMRCKCFIRRCAGFLSTLLKWLCVYFLCIKTISFESKIRNPQISGCTRVFNSHLVFLLV